MKMEFNEDVRKAAHILSQLGITANYAGFYQTAYAVSLSAHDPEKLLFVSKCIYPDVAIRCNTNARCIERNIRTVTKVSWKKNSLLLSELAEYPLAEKPGNAEFLAILATYLSRKQP